MGNKSPLIAAETVQSGLVLSECCQVATRSLAA